MLFLLSCLVTATTTYNIHLCTPLSLHKTGRQRRGGGVHSDVGSTGRMWTGSGSRPGQSRDTFILRKFCVTWCFLYFLFGKHGANETDSASLPPPVVGFGGRFFLLFSATDKRRRRIAVRLTKSRQKHQYFLQSKLSRKDPTKTNQIG